MNAPNPKKLMGDKKPPLHLLPLAGMVHQSLAHLDGNLKYGFENWNDAPVEKLTYVGAIMRHTELYKYGESYARDTGVHNLGAVMACCAILIDAELNGNLIDNTRHSKETCDLLHIAEGIVEKLNQAQTRRQLGTISGRKADIVILDDVGGDAPTDFVPRCGDKCITPKSCAEGMQCVAPMRQVGAP